MSRVCYIDNRNRVEITPQHPPSAPFHFFIMEDSLQKYQEKAERTKEAIAAFNARILAKKELKKKRTRKKAQKRYRTKKKKLKKTAIRIAKLKYKQQYPYGRTRYDASGNPIEIGVTPEAENAYYNRDIEALRAELASKPGPKRNIKKENEDYLKSLEKSGTSVDH